MRIPEDFYEPEVREGFYIPSEMKIYWAVMLDILENVDRVCKKYGLKYFADYGTMIGAVRHNGFIPWDDDFDISMVREDYMVFLKVAEKELPDGYKMLSVYNNHKSHTFLGRVVNKDLISMEEDFLKANHNCPYATGIDVFPVDHFEYDEKINELQKILIHGADEMAALIDEEETNVDNLHPVIRDRVNYLCDITGTKLEEGCYIRQAMFILSDRIAALFEKKAPYLAHMYFWEMKGAQVFPKEYFENTIRIPFECTTIPVPIAYDKILAACYGPNYMTPVRSGGVHDYPLYTIQREYMREVTGKVYYPEYDFQEGDLKRPSVEKVVRKRKEMVFLPFSPRYWKYMEKEWNKYAGSDEWDVYVIPIPYYRKKEYGRRGTLCYEIEGYPEYVDLTGFDAYDFDTRIPDRIVIQNPYDDYDNAITVHPRFYTELLRQITPELVYIPYFMTDDFDEKDERSVIVSAYYIRVPGVTRADKIILQSESYRQRYIDELTVFAGEDTRSIWEERIVTDTSIAPDEEPVGLYEEEVPDEWWKYLVDSDGEGRKVLLYHNNPGNMAVYKDEYFDKMERTFDVFAENKDRLSIFWHVNTGTPEHLEIYYPHLFERYKELYKKFNDLDLGVYSESNDHSREVAVADAYFGDRDSIMYDVRKLGKPVMIQNVEI